jgi:hypothetical protein
MSKGRQQVSAGAGGVESGDLIARAFAPGTGKAALRGGLLFCNCIFSNAAFPESHFHALACFPAWR